MTTIQLSCAVLRTQPTLEELRESGCSNPEDYIGTRIALQVPADAHLPTDRIDDFTEQLSTIMDQWIGDHVEDLAPAFPGTSWCVHLDYTVEVQRLALNGYWHKTSTRKDMARWN